MQFRGLVTLAAMALTASFSLLACQRDPREKASYAISVSGAGNQVTATVSQDVTLFEVTSQTGLGSADVQQVSGKPSTGTVIRLFLRGLEEFDFAYGEITIIVSVSSHGENAVYERVRSEGFGEMAIDSASPYWLPVAVVTTSASGDREATGYFDVRAPKDYFQEEYRAFSMTWIDFYR